MTDTATKYVVTDKDAGQRLDVFCVAHLPGFSRAVIQKAIKEGGIAVSGKLVKPRYLVKVGEVVEVSINTTTPVDPTSPPLGQGEEISFPIIYEDKDVVVINKPAGILVHPVRHDVAKPPFIPSCRGGKTTVAEWFVERYGRKNPLSPPYQGDIRDGIVHRLDRDTSGVLILARTPEAMEYLAKQFKAHRVKKEYLALVFGVPTMKEGRIVQAIIRSRQNPSRRTIVPPKDRSILAGKPAITEWRREKTFGDRHALLRVYPLTGRTHQIRVHLHFIGYPIVGDHLYTFKRQKSPAGVRRQMLHAERLKVTLPNGNSKVFIANLPSDFSEVLKIQNAK